MTSHKSSDRRFWGGVKSEREQNAPRWLHRSCTQRSKRSRANQTELYASLETCSPRSAGLERTEWQLQSEILPISRAFRSQQSLVSRMTPETSPLRPGKECSLPSQGFNTAPTPTQRSWPDGAAASQEMARRAKGISPRSPDDGHPFHVNPANDAAAWTNCACSNGKTCS